MNKTIISAQPDSLSNYLKKVWRKKSLILVLAKRDLKVKYAQTSLGLLWTMIQPLTALIIYTAFFSGMLNFQTEDPYILFVLSGLLFWNLFNNVFSHGSSSLMNNSDLIKKLDFPKIILPLSKALTAMLEFGISGILLVLCMIYFQTTLSPSLLFLPFAILTALFISMGMAMLLASFVVRKRDLFHIVPYLVNFGVWLTPVFYPVNILPEKYAHLIYFNPMASVIDFFRWCLFGSPIHSFMIFGLLISFLIFIIGFIRFKKIEDTIIDLI